MSEVDLGSAVQAVLPDRRPPRIALLLPRFSRYGGAEQFGYRLSEGLAQRGYEVDFICSRQEISPPAGVRVIRLGRPPGLKVLKMLWFLYKAERVCGRHHYDLVIGLGKTWSQDIIRMGGGPLAVFWQQSERALPLGPRRLAKQILRRLSPANWLTLLVEKRQFTRNAKVIAVSHLVREWLLSAHTALSPDRVLVLYNRPDPERYTYPDPEEKRGARERLALLCGLDPADDRLLQKPCIGTASTNFQLKGLEPLIRAVARLPRNPFLFVAGGRDATAYKKTADQLGIGDRVFFCGRVDDMPSFYKALDMFVLPTFYDACSNAVLEALVSGCKVIGSASDGSSFFLDSDRVLPDPGDVQDMAARMERLLDLPVPGPFVWPERVPGGLEAFIDLLVKNLPRDASD